MKKKVSYFPFLKPVKKDECLVVKNKKAISFLRQPIYHCLDYQIKSDRNRYSLFYQIISF